MTEEINEEKKEVVRIGFSVSTIFWGWLAYFFHRKHMDTSRPWWNGTGIRFFAAIVAAKITTEVLDLVFSLPLVSFLGSVLVFGFAGSWRFTKDLDVENYDAAAWKKDEIIAIVSGVLLCCACIALSLALEV